MSNKVYEGTVGLLIRIGMGEDISAASNYSLKVKKPTGELETWTPTIYGTTEFRYLTIAGDLDDIGTYVIQPELTLGAWSGLAIPVKFSVRPSPL